MAQKVWLCVCILIVIGGSTVAGSCAAVGADKNEEVEVVATVESPSGAHVATVYTAWGGGAAGYVYSVVNIRSSADVFAPRKDVVFSATKAGEVRIEWETDNLLIVEHSRDASISVSNETWENGGGVRITFVQRD